MKIKKYPQSHLVITKDDRKLCIDPGYLTYEKGFKVKEFQGADLYLITHQHADHLDPATIKEVVGENLVIANDDVIQKLTEIGVPNIQQINDRETIEAKGFKITAIDLPHVWLTQLKDTPPQNTGFVIDEIFFHSGDGLKVENLSVDNAALPIGHSAISINDVINTLKSLNAKVLIPIHYDKYLRDPQEIQDTSDNYKLSIQVRIIKTGEEIEI